MIKKSNLKNIISNEETLIITMLEDDKKILTDMGYKVINLEDRERKISSIESPEKYKKIYIVSDELDMLIHDGYYGEVYDNFLKELLLLDNDIVILSFDEENNSITDLLNNSKKNNKKEDIIKKLIAKGKKLDKNKIYRRIEFDFTKIIKEGGVCNG